MSTFIIDAIYSHMYLSKVYRTPPKHQIQAKPWDKEAGDDSAIFKLCESYKEAPGPSQWTVQCNSLEGTTLSTK